MHTRRQRVYIYIGFVCTCRVLYYVCIYVFKVQYRILVYHEITSFGGWLQGYSLFRGKIGRRFPLKTAIAFIHSRSDLPIMFAFSPLSYNIAFVKIIIIIGICKYIVQTYFKTFISFSSFIKCSVAIKTIVFSNENRPFLL